ncbi:MAG: hypothetical protein HC881_17340 [Leptolyngbyaceae cyanobacterium SL_7_1]|nr:hypothetical protein [Leptolyngbyaceae cyanobacterium SL_7_1]
MESNFLPAEVIVNDSRRVLGYLSLDWNPQPGAYLEIEGTTYIVLERRHRYQLSAGKYRLHKIALYVQAVAAPAEATLLDDGRWVIGDITCRYNARSELLRCAVNPKGACDRCIHYQPLDN